MEKSEGIYNKRDNEAHDVLIVHYGDLLNSES